MTICPWTTSFPGTTHWAEPNHCGTQIISDLFKALHATVALSMVLKFYINSQSRHLIFDCVPWSRITLISFEFLHTVNCQQVGWNYVRALHGTETLQNLAAAVKLYGRFSCMLQLKSFMQNVNSDFHVALQLHQPPLLYWHRIRPQHWAHSPSCSCSTSNMWSVVSSPIQLFF